MTSPGVYSDNLREYYFSDNQDVVSLDTLEFRHPAFAQPARVVNDPDDFIGVLDAGAPADANQQVTFTRCQFEIGLPESNSPGLPGCQLAVENIGKLLMQPIMDAVKVPHPIEITYRQWLANKDNVGMPGELGVVIDGMTLRRVNAGELRITGSAGFEDDLNTPFGRKKYTPAEYPGLVR